MRNALKKTGRKIFFSICNWGFENVTKWGRYVGNSWRTTKDIKDSWKSMIRIIDININGINMLDLEDGMILIC
jgi:alpha-galactosidase